MEGMSEASKRLEADVRPGDLDVKVLWKLSDAEELETTNISEDVLLSRTMPVLELRKTSSPNPHTGPERIWVAGRLRGFQTTEGKCASRLLSLCRSFAS